MLKFGPVLSSNLTAQMVEDMAQVVEDRVVIDFGGGGELTLLGLNTTDGLSDAILIS